MDSKDGAFALLVRIILPTLFVAAASAVVFILIGMVLLTMAINFG